MNDRFLIRITTYIALAARGHGESISLLVQLFSIVLAGEGPKAAS